MIALAGTSAFDARTLPRRGADGRLTARIDPAWSGYRGAHGGVVAAIALRAALDAAQGRAPRSLTAHLHAPAQEGEMVLVARIEREGRAVTAVGVRAEQQAGVVATATAILGDAGRDVRHDSMLMPDVPPPEACAPLGSAPVPEARAADHVEYRPAREPLPLQGSDLAEIAVWMRLGEDRAIDAALGTFLVDAAVPALYGRLDAYLPMPTVELAVHYAPRPVTPGPWALGVFRTALAGDGYASEDGELWTPAGEPILRARQLRRILG